MAAEAAAATSSSLSPPPLRAVVGSDLIYSGRKYEGTTEQVDGAIEGGEADVVLITTKGYHCETAARELRDSGLLRKDGNSVVVALLNGMGHAERIRKCLLPPPNRGGGNPSSVPAVVVPGITYLGCNLMAPRRGRDREGEEEEKEEGWNDEHDDEHDDAWTVQYNGKGPTYIGAPPSGGEEEKAKEDENMKGNERKEPPGFVDSRTTHSSDKNNLLATDIARISLRALSATLTAGGLPTSIASQKDMQRHLWRKLLVNVVVNPLTALTGCRNGVLGGQERVVDLITPPPPPPPPPSPSPSVPPSPSDTGGERTDKVPEYDVTLARKWHPVITAITQELIMVAQAVFKDNSEVIETLGLRPFLENNTINTVLKKVDVGSSRERQKKDEKRERNKNQVEDDDNDDDNGLDRLADAAAAVAIEGATRTAANTSSMLSDMTRWRKLNDDTRRMREEEEERRGRDKSENKGKRKKTMKEEVQKGNEEEEGQVDEDYRTEIDHLNGFLVREGAKFGLSLPVNSFVVHSVEALARSGTGRR